ncbi:alpha/beta-type small acid-soluble spore protein [Bacillus cereus]|uniref:alpha/beta-type small acid-soluble spore protein n=1 Tax=Bacillus cereus group TaxID=86661 RepID=UPI000995C27A|nr:alpha/beta-type small acid-soluble spore protein [Bacillus cereus]OPA24180.1 hypothetical protein BHL53_14555 [Bacillus cereus]
MNINTNTHKESWVNWMKDDIAREWGVTLGPDVAARTNGSVGGEITKRLVAMSLQQLTDTTNTKIHNWNIKQ